MALGWTQTLTEKMSPMGGGGKGQSALKADNLTAIRKPTVENTGVSTSHDPMGLHGLLQEGLTFYLYIVNSMRQ
jgi:hypothetical protein